MIGYFVYGYKVLETDIEDSAVIKFPDSDDEYCSTGSYLHTLYRNKKDAYEEIMRQYLEQKESIESKLRDIELQLSKL